MLNNALTSQDQFFKTNQKYLNWFAFFSIFPLISIAGISITFFIFLFISFIFLKNKKKLFKVTQSVDIFLLLFLLFVLISGLLTEDSYKPWTAFSIGKLMTQYIYWVIVALFIKTWIYHFDFYQLSRTIFFASITAIIYYMTLNPMHTILYPNEFSYVVVTTMPLAFYYIMKRYSNMYIFLIVVVYIVGIIASGSRTGLALIVFELALLFSFTSKKLKITAMSLLILSIPIVMVLFMSIDKNDVKEIKYNIAYMVEDISPKIAYTLRLEENVLERDKSFLIRKLMMQKGEIIFDKHPFFGVGIGNFTRYYTELNIPAISHWLKKNSLRYNKVSSQNSYLKIIAEAGILALISMVIVFLIIAWKGFYYIATFEKNAEVYIYIPFIALLFYGYILVTIQGALFWLLLGLALSLTEHKRSII